MAVAMKEAFSKKLGKIIASTDVSQDESLKKGLLCVDCNIDITYRIEHERNNCIIPASFIRKKGIEHKATCRFNTLGQLTIIAQQSNNNVLESINNRKFNLRLTLIHKSLQEVISNSAENKNKHPNLTVSQERNYQSKGKLDSYISTMRKIIELRNILEDKKELHNIIEISCHNRKVKWESFYYEPNRYLNAHKYLEKLKWEERHPICIEGTIYDIPYIEQIGKYIINLQWGKTTSNTLGIKYIPNVSVFLNNKELMKLGFQKGQRIAFCALCTSGMSKGKGTGREFHKIKAELYNKNQIIIL